MAKIKDLKTNKIYHVRTGNELLSAYRIDSSLPFKFGCCHGECGVCVLNIIAGGDQLSKPTKQEQITLAKKNLSPSTHRLACQCSLIGEELIIES